MRRGEGSSIPSLPQAHQTRETTQNSTHKMGRHSKSNNARAHFSNAELEMVKDRWGTKKARLTGDSMRGFDSCSLCLSVARDAVSCLEGHLFCRVSTYLPRRATDAGNKEG